MKNNYSKLLKVNSLIPLASQFLLIFYALSLVIFEKTAPPLANAVALLLVSLLTILLSKLTEIRILKNQAMLEKTKVM